MSDLARRSPAPAALALGLALGLAPAPLAIGQAPPSPPRSPAPAAPPANDPVVATFEGGTITKSEVLDFLGQYAIQPDRQGEVYEQAVNALVNQELLASFLQQQNVAVTGPELDAEVAKLSEQLQQSGQGTLNSLLAEMGLTEMELKERMMTGLRWSKYLQSRADEATLRSYFEQNKDLFTGTAVKASHILARVEPDASEGQKEEARQKLAELKKKIDAGELDFAVAADQYSEDPSNQEAPDGGNIGYFGKRGQVIDAFADAAFALEVGEVSDPVETDYGYHLIKVTDRREGQEVTFEQIREAVLSTYGDEIQEQLLDQARASAKLDIKPMPEDFFPAVPTTTPGSTLAPAPAAAPAGPGR
ncbi:foldase protein PrsA [Tautonia plasticadhaerens]|uniref:Foldase protein PrsA 1 n=1 Tax=Tautonia plasticadhaerens TaxID=2527974 RepID=A0A518GWI3_9BACT|nr:peptidylprolyl isomerase [Tautonia plasticadhaerens]QDV32956.1 Foldase protein PrsA 1 precursor [Tautonia plasticadhaerens]